MHPSREGAVGSTQAALQEGQALGEMEVVSEGAEGLPVPMLLPMPTLLLLRTFGKQEGMLKGAPGPSGPKAPGTAVPRTAWAGSENPMGVLGTSTWKFLAPSSQSNYNMLRLNING